MNRPHQAAETLRAMLESQLQGREDLTTELKETCAATMAALQATFVSGGSGGGGEGETGGRGGGGGVGDSVGGGGEAAAAAQGSGMALD